MSQQPPAGPPEGWGPPPGNEGPSSPPPPGQDWGPPSQSPEPPHGPPPAQQPATQQPAWGQPPPRADTRPWARRHPVLLALLLLGGLALAAVLSNGDGGTGTGSGSDSAVVEVMTNPDSLCWSGAFGNRTVDGCGSETVDLPAEVGDIYVANAQKQDEGGTLILTLKINGKVVDRVSTSAAYGVAQVQGQG